MLALMLDGSVIARGANLNGQPGHDPGGGGDQSTSRQFFNAIPAPLTNLP
ncbi:MAG: hypothetical protein U0414_11390 [Polyangiaceae bacterium]